MSGDYGYKSSSNPVETLSSLGGSWFAEANGLTALPSATNFVAVDCGRDGDFAKAVLSALIERGVFVRMPFAEPENRCIRVSAGTPEMLDVLEAVLPEALAEARAAL